MHRHGCGQRSQPGQQRTWWPSRHRGHARIHVGIVTVGGSGALMRELPARAPDPALIAAREGKLEVAMIGLCGCWGCTLSFLDIDERLLALLDKVTILRSSIS
jgi:hypothetical protein